MPTRWKWLIIPLALYASALSFLASATGAPVLLACVGSGYSGQDQDPPQAPYLTCAGNCGGSSCHNKKGSDAGGNFEFCTCGNDPESECCHIVLYANGTFSHHGDCIHCPGQSGACDIAGEGTQSDPKHAVCSGT